MKKTPAAITAIGSLLTLGAAVFATPVFAADKTDMEKCYGVAKAGKNDCQTAASSCAGTSKKDAQSDAWISVPKGTCDKITGGKLTSS
jgi:uncharacterized membrane protein